MDEMKKDYDSLKEKLDDLFEFPISYVVKAVGRNKKKFISNCIVVADGVIRDSTPRVSLRYSSGKTYVSVRFEFLAGSSDSIIELYQSLEKVKGLLYMI